MIAKSELISVSVENQTWKGWAPGIHGKRKFAIGDPISKVGGEYFWYGEAQQGSHEHNCEGMGTKSGKALGDTLTLHNLMTWRFTYASEGAPCRRLHLISGQQAFPDVMSFSPPLQRCGKCCKKMQY